MFTKTRTRIGLTAAAAIFSLAAHASNTVAFDPFGSAGTNGNLPVGGFQIDSLDWLPGNALAIGALSTPAYGSAAFTALGLAPVAGQLLGENYFKTVAQGKLGSFNDATLGGIGVLPSGFPAVVPFGREFTFQASFYEFGSSIGSATASFRLAPGLTDFSIYADSTSDSNTTTGAGYGNGTLIFQGTVGKVTGSYTTRTLLAGDADFGKTTLLDTFGTDQQNGVKTVIGDGSNKIVVNVNYLDPAYFLGNISQLLLKLDYLDATNLATPFAQTNPSDQVVGVTPSYSVVGGVATNGLACPTGSGVDENGNTVARCDFHFQSDASGSFVVPEPGSVALIGIALAALGFANRKRKSV